MLRISYLLTVFLLFGACQNKSKTSDINKEEIVIGAGVGMRDVVEELVKNYCEKTHENIKTTYASSGVLSRQIETGAHIDIFLAANMKWVDYLEKRDLTDTTTRDYLAQNMMVAIVPVNSSIDTLLFDKKTELDKLFEGPLSVGDPSHVPAGNYAVSILKKYGWYESLQPRFLPAKDVRAATMMVEMRECKLGFVFQSEAFQNNKVKVIGKAPADSHPKIVFGLVMTKGASQGAKKFYKYITSETGKAVWTKYGFSVIE